MKTLFLLIGTLLFTALSFAAEPTTTEFVKPFPIVAIPLGASNAHKAAARKIADAIGLSTINEVKTNPVCCIWIEITGWTPNPGEPGYVIINQGGGSIISASNEEQLRAAVDRFNASIRKNGNEIEVPVGLLTSYRLATEPVRGK